MIKGNVTAEEVKRAVSGRISSGIYPSGEQLPSVRTLAQELGANRNTVNKAYRALEQVGILQANASRKAFFVGTVPHAGGSVDNFRTQAMEIIWQAMAVGLSRRQVSDHLSSIITEVYGTNDIRLKFLECNTFDSETLGAELTRLSDVYIEPGLLGELDAAPMLAQDYDLIVTTLQHIAEVERAVEPFAHKVIGVDIRPSSDVLLELARLSVSPIGLVCGASNSILQLTHMILSYQPDHVIEGALVDDAVAVQRLVERCKALIVTRSSIPAFTLQTRRQPDVVVEFQIDAPSVAMLKRRIHAVRMERSNAT
jgi:DNA-binding transcriptional regulator YhcF (GntR family)